MIDVQLHSHYGPSATSKMGFQGPDSVMRKIIESNPDIEAEDAAKKLTAKAIGRLEASSLCRAMVLAEAIRSYWRVMRLIGADEDQDDGKDKPDLNDEARKLVLEGLVSFAMKMTGAQCAAAGRGYLELAKKLKPTQLVGDVFSRDEVRACLA